MNRRFISIMFAAALLMMVALCATASAEDKGKRIVRLPNETYVFENELVEYYHRLWWANPEPQVPPITICYTNGTTGETITLLCNQGATLGDVFAASGVDAAQIEVHSEYETVYFVLGGVQFFAVDETIKTIDPDALFDEWVGWFNIWPTLKDTITINGIDLDSVGTWEFLESFGLPTHLVYNRGDGRVDYLNHSYYWLYGDSYIRIALYNVIEIDMRATTFDKSSAIWTLR